MRARRVEVHDEVVRDGESVVLLGRQVIRLSWIGTTLLELCHDWRGADELTLGLTERYGEPPDGSDGMAMTVAALHALQEQGLVELA